MFRRKNLPVPSIQGESSWDASAGLLYHLLSGKLANGNMRSDDIKQLFLLRLLLADYAQRSASLPPDVSADFNARVIDYLGGKSAQHLWSGLGKTVSESRQTHSPTADVAIIATHPEGLRAAALVFDVFGAPARHPGDPAHFSTLDCVHLMGRRLSVGIFGADNADAGSLSLLINKMRHRRLPRLVCLLGMAAPLSADVAPFDVVAPRVAYRIPQAASDRDANLAGMQSLVPVDQGLHGLDAYDPAHTGYRERLQALMRRIPRQYKAGVKPGQLRPRFRTENCAAVSGVSISREDYSRTWLTFLRKDSAVYIADDEAYEFARLLPSEQWIIFRGVHESAIASEANSGFTYLATAVAALCLRDFLENCYVPPGAPEL